jgi:hypothetical protein
MQEFGVAGKALQWPYSRRERGVFFTGGDSLMFVPTVGKLVVRCQIGHGRNEWRLCYRDSVSDDWHYREICRIVNFAAVSRFRAFVETVLAEAAVPESNVVVHRHYCTWEELCAIRALWKSTVKFDDWVQEVLRSSSLSDTEKGRLQSAYQT